MSNIRRRDAAQSARLNLIRFKEGIPGNIRTRRARRIYSKYRRKLIPCNRGHRSGVTALSVEPRTDQKSCQDDNCANEHGDDTNQPMPSHSRTQAFPSSAFSTPRDRKSWQASAIVTFGQTSARRSSAAADPRSSPRSTTQQRAKRWFPGMPKLEIGRRAEACVSGCY